MAPRLGAAYSIRIGPRTWTCEDHRKFSSNVGVYCINANAAGSNTGICDGGTGARSERRTGLFCEPTCAMAASSFLRASPASSRSRWIISGHSVVGSVATAFIIRPQTMLYNSTAIPLNRQARQSRLLFITHCECLTCAKGTARDLLVNSGCQVVHDLYRTLLPAKFSGRLALGMSGSGCYRMNRLKSASWVMSARRRSTYGASILIVSLWRSGASKLMSSMRRSMTVMRRRAPMLSVVWLIL